MGVFTEEAGVSETDTKTEETTGTRRTLVRHIVELDEHGKPTDKCLCGHLWDVFPIPHGGEICQKCVDELRRRGQG